MCGYREHLDWAVYSGRAGNAANRGQAKLRSVCENSNLAPTRPGPRPSAGSRQAWRTVDNVGLRGSGRTQPFPRKACPECQWALGPPKGIRILCHTRAGGGPGSRCIRFRWPTSSPRAGGGPDEARFVDSRLRGNDRRRWFFDSSMARSSESEKPKPYERSHQMIENKRRHLLKYRKATK